MSGAPKRLLLPLLLIEPQTGRISRWIHKGPGMWGVRETHAVAVLDDYHVGSIPVEWYERYRISGER